MNTCSVPQNRNTTPGIFKKRFVTGGSRPKNGSWICSDRVVEKKKLNVNYNALLNMYCHIGPGSSWVIGGLLKALTPGVKLRVVRMLAINSHHLLSLLCCRDSNLLHFVQKYISLTIRPQLPHDLQHFHLVKLYFTIRWQVVYFT